MFEQLGYEFEKEYTSDGGMILSTVLYVVYAVIAYATLYGLNAPSGNPLESGF